MQKTNFTEDERAFSTTMDALFFLVLISVATAILLPSITADRQYDAAAYTATQDFDTHLLSSLLNSNVDEFEYEIAPLAIAGITTLENSIVSDPINTMFARQHKHRTFADMIAEDMLLTLAIEEEGSSKYINPIAQDHKTQTSTAIASYLEKRTAGRYEYHLEANWEPVEDYTLKSYVSVGMKPPYDAVRQSSRITLPLNQRTSRDELILTIDDSLLEDLHNSSNITKYTTYSAAFNDTIEEASLATAKTITGIIFPADYLRSLLRQDPSQNSKNAFIGAPQEDPTDSEMMVAMHILNYSTAPYTIYGENSTSGELTNGMVAIIEQDIIEHNQQKIADHLHSELDPDINETISKMVISTEINTTKELRDSQVNEIYGKVNNYYVDVTLSIW
ncbi:DUF7284 family protein [Methanococcoides sp. LMO-2]|uniref:Uncharacterized protein n=1 Tax=Methanococcoides cohabitans TaxID=3136559 RepID=A0ABU9KTF5_9EURY